MAKNLHNASPCWKAARPNERQLRSLFRVSQAQTIFVRYSHFVATCTAVVLPAILCRTRSALEREKESRIRLVVFVENLVPDLVEQISKETSVLTLSFAAATFVTVVTFGSYSFPFI